MVHNPQRTTFPEKAEDKIVKFKLVAKQLPAPFVIHADFECYTKQITNDEKSTNIIYQTAFVILW